MEINELKQKIIEASQKYYEGDPIISDDEFDALLCDLDEISPGDELLSKVAYGYSSKTDTSGEKVNHKYQTVGSLNKINATNCEKYFAQRPGQYLITSKIDGGSIVVYYDGKGNLDKAVTRGDGNIGIDCTSKLKYIVPQKVKLSNIAVRGEVIMTKEVFAEFYPDAASPRNSAMGIIGKDEPTIEEIKRLSFVAYNMYGNGINYQKSDIMAWLQENGFTTAEYSALTISVLDSGFLEALKGRLSKEFPADGLVITNEYRPSDEIAYKFVAESAETTVTKVQWETSRLGNIIPVVHFNPVKLSGAMLAKCSGFNAKWILDNKVGVGSKVTVQRSGEVIPYIKSVFPEIPGRRQTDRPSECPDCSTVLGWKGVHIYCPNESCPKKVQLNLLHWIEKMAPIDALGENILIPFIYNMGWRSASDIYNSSETNWLTQFQCLPVTDHAYKLLMEMYDKLYKEPVNPGKFFAAFGLSSVGETISKKISEEIGIHEYFKDVIFPWGFIEKLSRKTEPAVRSLYENYAMMKSVYHQIMGQQGFIEKEESKVKIKVAITGKLSKPRKELAEEFAENGIEVIGSITKECDYLITDDPASGSTKNLMAEKLGIVIVSENDFRELLKVNHGNLFT